MIWVDITNLPHVLLFRGFVKAHKCLVTARRFHQLEALLEMNHIHAAMVGRHGGSGLAEKLLESSRRVTELSSLVTRAAKVAVSKHSVELPRVAFGLGIPVLQIVDNEHAEHQNRLFLSLCTKVIAPKVLEKGKLLEQGASPSRVVRFRGVCEVAHLASFVPGPRPPGLPEGYILVRPVPRFAAYFRERDETQALIDGLKGEGHEVVVIPRGDEDYRNARVVRCTDGLNLIYHAGALVGGGGTMNREAALLGTPTISFYPQEPLGVDRFLMGKGLLHHAEGTREITELVRELAGEKERLRVRAKRLRTKLEDPIEVLEREISSLGGRPS